MYTFSINDKAIVLSPDKPNLPALSTKNSSITLGSDSTCDLVVAKVNPLHAKIESNHLGIVLSHIGVKGETLVNGKRIMRTRLQPGDKIELYAEIEEALPANTSTFIVAPIASAIKSPPSNLGTEGLLQLSTAFARPGSVLSKLEQILEFALSFGHFDRAAVWAVDPENSSKMLHHLTRQKDGQKPPVVSQTVLKQVLKGDALVITDTGIDHRVKSAASLKIQNVRSCVALPLKTTERVWGVLYLDCLKFQPFNNPEEQKFLASFASLAAIAIENGWLAANTQKQIQLKERLSRFFPPTTVDKILQQPDGRLAGMVLPVTILFCDIRNYTGISFSKPPALVAAWLDDYFAHIVPLVFENEGTLEKYIGDAMLAIWGAPTLISVEEQAERACRAALQIHQAVDNFSASWPQMPCQVGIGIHHGLAYVGTIGHESYLQYAALGSTTNLAARLCSAASAGETIVSSILASKLPAGEFLSEPRPPVSAKGFPELIDISLIKKVGY